VQFRENTIMTENEEKNLESDTQKTHAEVDQIVSRAEPEADPNVLKDNNKQTVGTSVLSKNWVKICLAVIPIVVAVGAYSSDSLALRLIPDDTFSVASWVNMGNRENSEGNVYTHWYRAYYDPNFGKLLAPIHAMVLIGIRNESNHSQIIRGVKIELLGYDNNWHPATTLLEEDGVIYITSKNTHPLTRGDLYDMKGLLLESIYSFPRLSPRDFVSGWLLLEFPAPHHEAAIKGRKLRITLHSGFGEKEEHEIKLVNNSDLLWPLTLKALLKTRDSVEDFSEFEVCSETDLNIRLQKTRDSP